MCSGLARSENGVYGLLLDFVATLSLEVFVSGRGLTCIRFANGLTATALIPKQGVYGTIV